MHLRSSAVAALTALAASAPTQASGRPAAVVPLLSVNLSDDDVDRLTAALAGGLRETCGAPVKGGRPVRRLLPEGGLPGDCAISAACLDDVRGRLAVEDLVFVVLTRLGDDVQVDPSIVRGKEVEARPAVRGPWTRLARREGWRGRVEGWLPPAPSVETAVDPPARDGGGVPEWPVWTLAGLSVVSLGAGIGFGVGSQATTDDLVDRGCLQTRCPDGDIDRASSLALTADVLYAVSGVSAAAALVIYLLADDDVPVAVEVGHRRVAIGARF